jgi:hypothetical protein
MLVSTMEHIINMHQNSMDHYGYSSRPHQAPSTIGHSPRLLAASESSTASSNSSLSTSTQKRGRLDHVDRADSYFHYHSSLQIPLVGNEETPFVCVTPQKKARSSTYEAPRAVKPSILTAMGTLAVNGAPGPINGGSVPVRRRLSGGNLEEFLGTRDQNMDTDTSDSRPRSMSF